MNIPIPILKRVPASTFAFHQSLAKKMIKVQNQKSSISASKNSISQDDCCNPSVFQSEVISWFFNQEPSIRFKLCSIQNKYLILILHQMRIEFQKYSSNINFRIIQECKGDFKLEDLTYSLFFQNSEPHCIKMNKHEGREAEHLFLKEICFLSSSEYNDIMTLSHNLIQNEDLFKRLFFVISNKQCFEEPIKAYQEQDEKYHNFELPSWVQRKSELTLGQIVLMYIEQVILINYTHCKLLNEIYSYPHYSKVQEIIDTSATLITFISESSNKVELYNTILFNSIRKSIKEDEIICGLIKKHQELVTMIFEKKKTISEQIDDTNMKLRQNYLDTHRFITEITFISFNNLFKVEDFVCKMILKHFMGLYQEKNVDDLLNDEEVAIKLDNSNNKKKKKKKKKKNKQTGNLEMDKPLALPSPSEVNLNMGETKVNIDIESNSNTNNQLQQSNSKLGIGSEESNQDSEKNEEEEVQFKRKSFFLYPINNKKKERTKENNSSMKKNSEKNKKAIIEPKEKERNKTDVIEINSPEKEELQPCISSTTIVPQTGGITKSKSIDNAFTPSHFNDISRQNNFFLIPNYNLPYDSPNYNPNNIYSSYNLFLMQLTKEIDDFASGVLYHKQLLNKTRKDTINRLTSLISDTLQKEYIFEIDFYGSYATDLSIESSDIDILIHFKPMDPLVKPKTETILLLLAKSFLDKKDFLSKVEPILTASVPVIKLEFNILKSLDSETTASIRHNYAFNFEEVFTIKFDITFASSDLDKEQHPTLKVVQYIKELTVVFPQMKKALFVLKRYLQIQKVNSCFHGGLSSFSLFLLLVAFMKIRNGRLVGNGEVLFDFFEYYSKFDFSHFTINVNLDNPFVYHSELRASPIYILDPFTGFNVAKSSFLIQEVKFSFTKAINYLFKYQYNEFGIEKPFILNGLFSL